MLFNCLLRALIVLSLLFPLKVMSGVTTPIETDQGVYDQRPWSILYYYGITGSNPLFRILSGTFHRFPEHIQTIEIAHTLNIDNPLRQLVHPLVGVVQLAGNITMRTGSNEPTITELNPYLMFRWAHFPWNPYLATSLSVGEGISYTSSIPELEKKDNAHTKRLLNYLMLEATFAHPKLPQLQYVVRIHHRSGAYGIYHAGNTGSNAIGLGIRYLFD
jgi:hypothetical protein